MKATRKKRLNTRPGRQFKSGNPGRPKGAVNKFTTLKQSFLNVYGRMGGENTLLEFAKTHKALFYGMLTKLFPQELEHSGDLSLDITAKQIWNQIEKAKKEMGAI